MSGESVKDFSDLPGPWGWPIVGSALDIATDKEKVFWNWAKNYYGPIFRFKMGSRSALVVHGYDLVKEAMVERAEANSGRMEGEVIKQARNNMGLFFTQYGEFWKEWRKIATENISAVLDNALVGVFTETDHFKSLLMENLDVPFDLRETRLPLTMLNGVMQMCFSRRFDLTDPEALKLYESIYYAIGNPKFNALLSMGWLRYIPSYGRYLRETGQHRLSTLALITKLIDERREDPNTNLDFVTSYYNGCGEKDNKEALATLIEDMVFAGAVTTGNQCLWAILFLLKKPECLEKAQAEIDRDLADCGWPSKSGLESGGLNYVKAIVHEAFRLRPIAPTSLPHVTTAETIIGGYRIPKDVVVFPSIWSVHHDPETWAPDPEAFRPERHLDASGIFQKPEQVIPFCIGWRRCVGQKLAENEILIHLVTVLKNFNMRLADESKDIDTTGETAGILRANPFKIVFNLRI